MLTMNKALMDLIMDGAGPRWVGWVVFGLAWAGAKRKVEQFKTSYEEYPLGTRITCYYFPRNLQKDPLFPDPEKTWVSNSSIATYLGVRW